MKSYLTILILTAGMLIGSSAAMAASYSTPFDQMPNWAEDSFIPND